MFKKLLQQIDEEFKSCDISVDVAKQTLSNKQSDYGEADNMLQNIADRWSKYLNVDLDRADVAMLMSLLKSERLRYQVKFDSRLDKACYLLLVYKQLVDKDVSVKDECLKRLWNFYNNSKI